MAAISPAFRKLFQILFGSSVRRCLLSGILCRLTISLKVFRDANPRTVRVSISDTGNGSSLVEFKELEFGTLALTDKWDGVLSVTTTSINDKEINHYHLNLGETLASRKRLKRLPSTQKNVGMFSGTEVCLSLVEEDSFDDLMAWMVYFVRKMAILKAQNVATELVVEHVESEGLTRNHHLQATSDSFTPISTPCIDSLISGLEDYVLKHGNAVGEKCQTCFAVRENLKVGHGQASSAENCRGTGQIVEVVIVLATVSTQSCCWRANSSATQVLYFRDFSPSSISQSLCNALISVNWQNYGLNLRGSFVDGDGHAVLEWENIPLFTHVDIAINSYHRIILPQAQQEAPAERNLVKKAVKSAMDDLKAKYTGLFLSSHASKMREYAPDLSKTIAGLISSSNDSEFRSECAALLGVHSVEGGGEESIESCIQEKIIGIIEMNDRKLKVERDAAPYLFECESFCDEECPDEEYEHAEEDVSILDI